MTVNELTAYRARHGEVNMKLVSTDDPQALSEDDVLIAVSRDELAGLVNAIGESLQALDKWEYGTRVGLLPDEAERLRDQISDVLHAVRRPQ